ncbi:hypothetical protein AM609_13825 [Actinomyces sp. oral taxon 414]|nr:hypothetical protein AM609_13825 [Actinomyces sp. oral taxon 414]
MCAGGGGSRCEWILQALMGAMVCSTTWRIRLMLLLASWAASLSSLLGGFLCGVIIPLPMYPLSAIHPEGSSPRESLSPMLGGYPSTPSARRRMSRLANSAAGSPVA